MKKAAFVGFNNSSHQSLLTWSKLRCVAGIGMLICFQVVSINSEAQYTKLLDFEVTAYGQHPSGTPLSDGTFLYGMTVTSGANSFGTVFKLKPDGTGYVRLLDFDGATTGRYPYGDLISDGAFLYGMSRQGGTNDEGTIFKIKTDGSGYSKLLDFASGTSGSYPHGSVISDGTFLYGTTRRGGLNDLGTIFKIQLDGTGFTKLLDFSGTINGSTPYGSLIFNGGFLYGMTSAGGASNLGTIFKLKPDGTGYQKVLEFSGATDGQQPYGDLIYNGTFLFGMTTWGGANNMGTIFKIMPDGTGYVKLLDFSGIANGNSPQGSLLLEGAFLYGMTPNGGTSNNGTIFKIKPDGTEFSKLLDFEGISNGNWPFDSFISDGKFLYGTTERGGEYGSGTMFKYSIAPAAGTIAFASQPANQSLCQGSNTTFTLVASGDTNLQYQWQIDNNGFADLINDSTYSGVNTATLTLTNATALLDGTNYRCNVAGDNSVSTSSGNAMLTVKPLPVAMISLSGNELMASVGDTYQWYQNGEAISDATSSVFELANFLEYAVYTVAISLNGCTATSNDFVHLITGNELGMKDWKIYPNPFTTTLSIESSSLEKMEIEIIDILGRPVKRIIEFSSDMILLEELKDGSYFLNIRTAKQSVHFRIVKTH